MSILIREFDLNHACERTLPSLHLSLALGIRLAYHLSKPRMASFRIRWRKDRPPERRGQLAPHDKEYWDLRLSPQEPYIERFLAYLIISDCNLLSTQNLSELSWVKVLSPCFQALGRCERYHLHCANQTPQARFA